MRQDRPAVTSRLRLRNFDYASPGTYFVTICTANRASLFGEVVDGTLHLSTAGLMVESWWHSIPRRYPHSAAAEVIVMPNHLHGLLMLGAMPVDKDTTPPSLSEIIGWFKSATTHDYSVGVKTADWPRFPRRLWQSGFHDHVVRTARARRRIVNYMERNPSSWERDAFYPDR